MVKFLSLVCVFKVGLFFVFSFWLLLLVLETGVSVLGIESSFGQQEVGRLVVRLAYCSV